VDIQRVQLGERGFFTGGTETENDIQAQVGTMAKRRYVFDYCRRIYKLSGGFPYQCFEMLMTRPIGREVGSEWMGSFEFLKSIFEEESNVILRVKRIVKRNFRVEFVDKPRGKRGGDMVLRATGDEEE